MSGVIDRLSGAKSSNVLVGPRHGVDVSVIRIDKQRVMITSCDPLSFIPQIGPEDSARMSAYEVASDLATSGNLPKFAMIDLNLPPHMTDDTLIRYWRSFHKTCRELGIAIVGGHTGRFEGCDYSIIGTATLWTTCGESDYLTSMMAQDGDDLILTKTAAYGATSVLARTFPRTVKKALGPSLFSRAQQYFALSNIVNDALVASGGGIHENGVTAMHDATEGGVVAALIEIAEASGLGGSVMLDEIPVSDETRLLCRLFEIDPLISLGEGSLVVACTPRRTDKVLERLRSKGIRATVVGKLSSKLPALRGTASKGQTTLRYPDADPYWKAYWKGTAKGWP